MVSSASLPLSSSSQRTKGLVRGDLAKPVSDYNGSRDLDLEVPPGFEHFPSLKFTLSYVWDSFFDKQKDPVPEAEITFFHLSLKMGRELLLSFLQHFLRRKLVAVKIWWSCFLWVRDFLSFI